MGIEYSVNRAYDIPREVKISRPTGANEWHDLVLHVLLRRRAFLPALCWPGSANSTTPYHMVWNPSNPLRRTLCTILQPGESINEYWPENASSTNYGPVHTVGREALSLPPEVSGAYSVLSMAPAVQHQLMLHILSQGEVASVEGIDKLFQSKKFKKRQEVLLPVLVLRYFIIQCSQGSMEIEPPMNMVVVGTILALAMLQPEVDRSMYLREVVGMDPMALQCNQMFMSFLAAYQGCLHMAAMLNDVCGSPLHCDPRAMYDGQWLHTLLSSRQLCLTERPPEKKKPDVLELGFPVKIAELTMALFEELMNSLPEDAQKSIQGEYVGKPPTGRFRAKAAKK